MSAPFPRNVIRAPGKLVKNPTNLNTAYPHGGTELGEVRQMVFRFGMESEKLVAEEWRRPVSVIITDEIAIMAGILRSYDNDLLATLFPNTSTGTSSGAVVVNSFANAGNRAGYDMAAQSVKLLFSPQAVDHHPMILVYNAVPLPDNSANLRLAVGEEYGLAFMFLVTPDSRGWDYRLGNRDDLAAFI